MKEVFCMIAWVMLHLQMFKSQFTSSIRSNPSTKMWYQIYFASFQYTFKSGLPWALENDWASDRSEADFNGGEGAAPMPWLDLIWYSF